MFVVVLPHAGQQQLLEFIQHLVLHRVLNLVTYCIWYYIVYTQHLVSAAVEASFGRRSLTYSRIASNNFGLRHFTCRCIPLDEVINVLGIFCLHLCFRSIYVGGVCTLPSMNHPQ